VKDFTDKEELQSIKNLANYSINTASSTLEKAKSVAVSTTEMGLQVGQEFAQTSVDVLETIGKSALDFLTVQEDSTSTTTTTRSTHNNNSISDSNAEKNYFEQYEGTRFVEALEKLSIESNIRLQKSTPLLEAASLQPYLLQLKSAFDEESSSSNNDISDSTTISNANHVFNDSLSLIDTLKITFEKAIQDENEASEIIQITASYLDKCILESTKNISKYSAVAIGDLYNYVESISSSNIISVEDSLSKSILVSNLISKVIEDLNTLSNHYTNLLQSIVDTSISKIKGEETDKYAEELQSKLNLHKHHIEIDTSSYTSTLVDVKQFLFVICKSFFYSTNPPTTTPQ
jgi:hypothetical protein